MARTVPCAGCAKPIQHGPTSRPPGQAKCRECWRTEIEHGTVKRGYLKGCRCAECREAKRVDHLAYRQRRKARTGRGQSPRKDREIIGATCVGCGEPVRGNFKKEVPWHRACRELAERASRERDRKRDRKRALAAAKLTKAAKGASSRWTWTEGPCDWCAERFCARGTGVAKYCSARCLRKAAGSRRPGKFKIRPAERLAIYERDNWTCQLCHGPVDPSLPPLDDWAASLDHVECQAWALIPDHSPGNLRLAHRWCNSVRGDETHYAATDLAA